jgi:hypothetical protein
MRDKKTGHYEVSVVGADGSREARLERIISEMLNEFGADPDHLQVNLDGWEVVIGIKWVEDK